MRKILAFITATVMLLSLIPVSYSAASAPEGLPISSSADFMAMDPAGKYYLTADITLLATYETAFTGVFDGNGHTITVAMTPFAEFSGTVKNLTIEGSVTDTAGFARKATGQITVENVVNKAEVLADSLTDQGYAGGIVAQVVIGDGAGTASFTNCENKGTVKGYKRAGGIVGQSFASENEIHSCINSGNVTGGSYVGGIVGQIGADTAGLANFHITDCYNTGDILSYAISTAACAGIMARCGSKAQKVEYIVENCGNTGKITIDSTTTEGDYAIYAGGVTGYFYGGSINAVRHCYNTGDVSVKSMLTTSAGVKASYAAGVLGYVSATTFTFTDSYNTGKVTCSDTRVFEGFETHRAAAIGYNNNTSGSYLFTNLWTLEGCCDKILINGDILDEAHTFTDAELKNGTLCTKINEACDLRETYSDGAYYYMDGIDLVLYGVAGFNAAPEFKEVETTVAETTVAKTVAETKKKEEPATEPAETETTAATEETAAVQTGEQQPAAEKKGCTGAIGTAVIAAVIPAACLIKKKKEE